MAKKSFINRDNPALNFISAAREADPAPAAERKAPAGYKMNPAFVEKRTRRLQLVLQPSLYEKVKDAAKNRGVSVNDYIHSLLEDATEGEN